MTARHRAVAIALSATIAVLPIAAQQPTLPQNVFRAGTTLIPVDVRVVDKNGKPVTDLSESDFTILEDGVAQRIGHFSMQAFTPEPPLAADATGPRQPRRAADAFEMVAENRRTFLIVLGRGRLQPPSGGVDAMLHFVRDRLLPQDQVAVLGWNRATDFLTDHGQIATILERFKKAHEGIEMRIVDWSRSLAAVYGNGDLPAHIQKAIDDVFGGPRAENMRTLGDHLAAKAMREQGSRAAFDSLGGQSLSPVDRVEFDRLGGNLDDFLTANAQIASDLNKLYLGIEYLRHLAGEKHLVFLSEYGISLPFTEDERDIGRTAADARVVIDVIHAGGVPLGFSGLSSAPVGGTITNAVAARTLTGMTGGRFFANRFKSASTDIDLIDQAAGFAYVLGYYPTRPVWDGKFRKIAVKVNRPDLTVLYRNGYYARRELPAFDRKTVFVYTRVASGAEYAKPIFDIGVTATPATASMKGKSGNVSGEVTIDLSRVAFEKRDGVNFGEIEIAVFGVTARQQTVGSSWQTLGLTYTDDKLAVVRRDGLRHVVTVPVTEIVKNLKVVVYDYGADLLGTVVAPVKSR